MVTVIDRFFKHVLPVSCGCWVWTGCTDTPGYGKFAIHITRQRKVEQIGAHKFSYILHNKTDIPAGLNVCHTCDIKRCVNPAHLFLGTQKDNMQDCVRKGRLSHKRATCEGHAAAKLTWSQVDEIRALYASGMLSQTQLASLFKLGQSAISAIVREATWHPSKRA